MSHEISNMDDVIDSRDVIARIEELQDERQCLVDTITEEEQNRSELQDGDTRANHEAAEEALDDARTSLKSWDADYAHELAALKTLAEEAEGYAADWHHGETLIRDSYFETAMDELLEDIGDLPKNLPGYLTITVDYDALQMDYTSVDFDGVTYWIR